ncbi:MAG TPA: D-alanyl-D-alanine carboxypeptidase family protein [Chloroflexota bacterium]
MRRRSPYHLSVRRQAYRRRRSFLTYCMPIGAVLLAIGLWVGVTRYGPTAAAPNTTAPPDPTATAGSESPLLSLPPLLLKPSPTPFPQWVTPDGTIDVWSGPGSDAQRVGSVSRWATLEVLRAEGARFEVRRRGAEPLGWIDAARVHPSTPPPAVTPTPSAAPPVPTGEVTPPPVSAELYAVVDEGSGALLFGSNANTRVAPASLTKIVTALVAIEHGNPETMVRVDVDSREMVDSTVMGLLPGQELTLKDLLYGLMLPSGNDAAIAIAEHIAGSEASFADLMNEKVAELGLENSHFVNPHGLDAPGHYSSPYDMAMLARYGMLHHALFRDLAVRRSWDVGGSRPHTVWNLNRFLWSYEGADGVKVGYTDQAGRAIVASATRGGHRVYVALMRSADLVTDCIALFDYTFEHYRWADQPPS